MDDYLHNIGQAIARQRKRAGFTQAYVAEHLGLGKGTLSRIENGDIAVTVDKLYQLRKLFNCRIADFLWIKEEDRARRVLEIMDIIDSVPEEKREIMLDFLTRAVDNIN